MTSRSSTLACVALTFGIAALLPACTKEGDYFLLVDVSLKPGVPTPDHVRLTATHSGTTLKQITVAWPSANPATLEVGLALPSDATGPVEVTGIALLDDKPVGEGNATQEYIAKGQNNGPLPLDLRPSPATPVDGGAADTATDGTGGPDGSVLDSSPTGGTDGPDKDASATGGTDGVLVVDAAPDVQGAESAPDAVSADATLDAAPDGPIDGSLDAAAVADVLPDADTEPDGGGRQWSAPRNVQNNPGSVSSPIPSVAVSPVTGDAVVAWYDSVGGVQAIHYAAAVDKWDTSPATLETRGAAVSVQAGVDGNGHYVVVWAQNDQTQTAASLGLWASYSSDGVTWSNPPVLLAAGPSNASYWDIRLAVNRAGQAWVVWDQAIDPVTSSTDPESVYALYLNGIAAKPAVLLKVGISGSFSVGSRAPRVAIDGKGNGLCVWTELDTDPAVGEFSTWAAALADGTTPAPQLVESYDADSTFGADVAMNAAGQGVAVWVESRSSGGYTVADIFARRYSVATGWDPEPPRLYAANYSGNLSVDEDRYGTVSIGWSQPATGRYQAMFSTQAVGGAWSSSNLEIDDLAPGYTSTDIEPQVRTALDSGDVLMAWRKRVDGSTFAPHFRWRSNGTWGVESEVGKIADLYASDIHVGVADDGRAVAAWTYYHCYYLSSHPDKCADVPLSSLPASAQAAIGNLFVAVYK